MLLAAVVELCAFPCRCVVQWSFFGRLFRAVAVRCGCGGLAHCYCVIIAASHAEGEQQQRRHCCVAVACGNLGIFPLGLLWGCPVAVFASCSVAAAIATAYGSMYFEHVCRVAALDSQPLWWYGVCRAVV